MNFEMPLAEEDAFLVNRILCSAIGFRFKHKSENLGVPGFTVARTGILENRSL